jgi:hypothetical protein
MSKQLFGIGNNANSTNRGGGASQANNSGEGDSKGTMRNILVHITGNRATWEHMGIHGALWRINPEKASLIFNYENSSGPEGGGGHAKNPQHDPFTGMLSNGGLVDERVSRALIKKITVVESHTNVDEVIGVSIDGLPPKEFTGSGDTASLYLLGSGRVTEPQEIFSLTGNTELGMAWMKQYPQYTPDNLHDEGVMFLSGASYYFVHESHPAIHMLRVNQDQLGVLISEETQVQQGWHKVDMEAFLFCIKTLRENILQSAPSTFDLSSLTVRIHKPDGQRWLHLPPQVIEGLSSGGGVVQSQVRSMMVGGDGSEVLEISASDSQEAKIVQIQKYLDKPLFVTLRLAIEYTLPELPNQQTNNNSTTNVSGAAANASVQAQQAPQVTMGHHHSAIGAHGASKK